MKSFVIALAFFLSVAISADAANAWTVERSSGQVSIAARGAQKISLGSKSDLPNGATITTGPSGRVLLVRGKETMSVGPNSVVTVPGDNLFGFTTILQTAGNVEFDVEKKNVLHFAVKTPFLAAVVKGTHFTVRVNRASAKVSVSRGRVGVSDNATGQKSDVTPGQSAEVSTNGMVLTGQGAVQPKPAFDVTGLFDKQPGGVSFAGGWSNGGNSGSGGSGSSGSGSSGSGSSGSGSSGSGSSGSGSSGSGSSGSGSSGSGSSGSGSGGSGHGGGDDDDC